MTSPPLRPDGDFRPLMWPDCPGWRMCGKGGFSWQAGELGPVLESWGGPGLLWYAAESFTDCALRVDWRSQDIADNSGVFLRCPPLEADPSVAYPQSYEIQIDDRGVDNEGKRMDSPLHLTGAVYRLAPAVGRPGNPPGQWNRFDILIRGGDITVWLNGTEVSRLIGGTRRPDGHIAIQNHHEGSRVQFGLIGVGPA